MREALAGRSDGGTDTRLLGRVLLLLLLLQLGRRHRLRLLTVRRVAVRVIEGCAAELHPGSVDGRIETGRHAGCIGTGG